jgi:tetratricopeptide (TPR) repeat protein
MDVIYLLSEEKFNEYVTYLLENESIYDLVLRGIMDYSSAESHATLARIIMRHYNNQHLEHRKDAITLLESSIKMHLTTEQYDDGFIDYDQIIWAYRDIMPLYWSEYGDAQRSYELSLEALKILELVSDDDLAFGVRGEIWYNKWYFLSKLGKEAEAIADCKTIIQETETKNLPYKENSMLYFGNLFLAVVSKWQKNYLQAIEYLEKAASYTSLDDDSQKYYLKQFKKSLPMKNENPKLCYEELIKILDMVTSMHPAWDFDPKLLVEKNEQQ